MRLGSRVYSLTHCHISYMTPAARLLHWRPAGAMPGVGVRVPRAASNGRPAVSLRPLFPPMALKMSSSTKIDWTKELIFEHPENNVSPYIANLVGRDLHLKKDHPLGIILDKVETYGFFFTPNKE